MFPRHSGTPVLLLTALLGLTAHEPGIAAPPPATASELYTAGKVWDVHLQFRQDQWEAIEPESPEGERGPGRSPGRGPGRPEGGRPGGFGPGMFLGPAVVAQADADRNGSVTEAEWNTIGRKWFQEWNTGAAPALDEGALKEGINRAFGMPAGGPPRRPGGDSFLLGREGGRNGLSAARGIVFEYVRADLEFAGDRLPDVAVRYKGNGTYMTSQGGPKRPLKLDLNKHAKGRKLAGVTKLNLHNNVTDPSGMNESIAYRLYRDAGVPAPRTTHARVRLTVAGGQQETLLGLYSIVENVDGQFAADRYGSKDVLILKPVTQQPFEYLGDDWQRYQQAYDPKTGITPRQTGRILEFCRLVSQADDATFAARVGEYLDLEEFARYMAVTVWISTLDSLLGVGQNYLVCLNPKTDRFEFIPWDLDHAFGQFGMVGTQAEREQLSIREPWHQDVLLLKRVFGVPAFMERYLGLMREYQQTLFRPERIAAQVDALATALRPAVAEEGPENLARFDAAVSGQAVAPPGPFGGGGGPGGFRMDPPKPIKGFVAPRHASVGAQLSGSSAGLRAGDTARRQPPGGGRPGPGEFLAGGFLGSMDSDSDRRLSAAEFESGMSRWFRAWDADHDASLSPDEVRDGMNAAFDPFRNGPPRGR